MADKINKAPKLKRKVRSGDRSQINDKLKRSVEPGKEKTMDERLLDVSIDPDMQNLNSSKPDVVEKRDERINYLTGKGTQHPVHEMIQNIRTLLINSGFNELETSFFVGENEIFKQHNIKSHQVFEKIYHLAENKLTDNDDNESLEVAPALKNFKTELTKTTLRSIISPSWFTTLASIMDKDSLPIKVYSTGVWFKRLKEPNELNLRSHYGASCIIIDDKISLDNGKVIAEEILNRLGFDDLDFARNKNIDDLDLFSKELEIFANDLKIATCGKFSKKILKKYGIDIPVIYINFGLEHMVMVQKGIEDIRELMYPQFHKAWKLNDHEIAEAIEFIHEPKTDLGLEIASNLIQICEKNHNAPSPCEFTVWKGSTSFNAEKQLVVSVIKRDKESKLCGPAFLNEIVVKNGDVFGIQNIEQNQDLSDAKKTQIRYLDAFSKLVGSEIETKLDAGEVQDMAAISVGIIREMEDINLQIDSKAFRYLLTNNKKIDVRGPMFITVEYSLKQKENDT